MKNEINPHLDAISDCLYRLAVKAIIVRDHKLLLVHEIGDAWWNLPGGGVEHGETLEEALTRELAEELGVTSRQIRMKPGVAFATVGAVVSGIPKANIFYLADVAKTRFSPTEHVDQTQWVAPNDLANLYLSPSSGPVVRRLVDIINQS